MILDPRDINWEGKQGEMIQSIFYDKKITRNLQVIDIYLWVI